MLDMMMRSRFYCQIEQGQTAFRMPDNVKIDFCIDIARHCCFLSGSSHSAKPAKTG